MSGLGHLVTVELPAGTVIALALIACALFMTLFWLAWFDGRKVGRHNAAVAESLALDQAFKAGYAAHAAAIQRLAQLEPKPTGSYLIDGSGRAPTTVVPVFQTGPEDDTTPQPRPLPSRKTWS